MSSKRSKKHDKRGLSGDSKTKDEEKLLFLMQIEFKKKSAPYHMALYLTGEGRLSSPQHGSLFHPRKADPETPGSTPSKFELDIFEDFDPTKCKTFDIEKTIVLGSMYASKREMLKRMARRFTPSLPTIDNDEYPSCRIWYRDFLVKLIEDKVLDYELNLRKAASELSNELTSVTRAA